MYIINHKMPQMENCSVCDILIMISYPISSNAENWNWLCPYTAAFVSIYKPHLLKHTPHQNNPERNGPPFFKPEVNWALWRGIITVSRDRTQLPPLSHRCRANFISPQRLSFLQARADVKAPPSNFLAAWALWPSAAHLA